MKQTRIAALESRIARFERKLTAADWDMWSTASKLVVAVVYEHGEGDPDVEWLARTIKAAPHLDKANFPSWEGTPMGDAASAAKWRAHWEKLNRKYSRLLKQIPGKVGMRFNSNWMPFPSKGTDARAMKWIKENLQFRGPFIVGKLDKAKVLKQRKDNHKAAKAKLLAIIDKQLARRPNKFYQSLRDQLAKKGWLSEKQLRSLKDFPSGDEGLGYFGLFESQQGRGWDFEAPMNSVKPWDAVP